MGECRTTTSRSKGWEYLETSGGWMSSKMDVLFEHGLEERHFISLKRFA